MLSPLKPVLLALPFLACGGGDIAGSIPPPFAQESDPAIAACVADATDWCNVQCRFADVDGCILAQVAWCETCAPGLPVVLDECPETVPSCPEGKQ